MFRSKRRTSKFWLGVLLVTSIVALFYSLYQSLETATVGITVMIPAIYGAYVGVGHLDYRQATSILSEEGEP
jgi:uncharacterized membrane protein YhhN